MALKQMNNNKKTQYLEFEITEDVQNLNPDGFIKNGNISINYIVLNSTASFNIGGLKSPDTGDIWRVTFINSTVPDVVFVDKDLGSAAKNRFNLLGLDYVLNRNKSVTFIYFPQISKWILE